MSTSVPEGTKKEELCPLELSPLCSRQNKQTNDTATTQKAFGKKPKKSRGITATGGAGAQWRSCRAANLEMMNHQGFSAFGPLHYVELSSCQRPGCFYVFQAFADLLFFHIQTDSWRLPCQTLALGHSQLFWWFLMTPQNWGRGFMGCIPTVTCWYKFLPLLNLEWPVHLVAS